MEETLLLFQQLAISLLLGLLVGLQRERTEPEMAGIRTFPLLTVFGTLCAALSQAFDYEWIMAAGFVGVIGLIVVGNLAKLKQENPGAGITTEIAILVMFAVGAFVAVGPWSVAAAVAGGVAILLHLKPQMHGLAKRMGDEDFRAILQFVLVTFIILPVVPNKAYDPFSLLRPMFPDAQFAQFDVLNPYEIWLMVVLVVAISLGGYVSYKLFGRDAGIVLSGILGGTISSTATTVSNARRTVNTPGAVGLATVVIMIASTVTFIRVLLEIAVAAPAFLPVAGWPLLVMFGVCAALAVVAWMLPHHGESETPAHGNPSELKPALIFAAMYAFVTLAVAVGKEYLKDEGLYVIAGLSGMTDMDAITLSTARLVNSGRLDADNGWRLIVVGTLSNLVFKAIIVAAIGRRDLFLRVASLFGVALLAGCAVLVFWP